jgi:hypothetical protein
MYKSFRAARSALQEFKKKLKREPLQFEFKVGHVEQAGSPVWDFGRL